MVLKQKVAGVPQKLFRKNPKENLSPRAIYVKLQPISFHLYKNCALSKMFFSGSVEIFYKNYTNYSILMVRPHKTKPVSALKFQKLRIQLSLLEKYIFRNGYQVYFKKCLGRSFFFFMQPTLHISKLFHVTFSHSLSNFESISLFLFREIYRVKLITTGQPLDAFPFYN